MISKNEVLVNQGGKITYDDRCDVSILFANYFDEQRLSIKQKWRHKISRSLEDGL